MSFRERRQVGFGTKMLALAVVGTLGLVFAGVASAKVFASQKQALAEAFPDASRIDRKTVILRKRDAAAIAEIIHEEIQAKVVVLHTAYEGEKIIGYAHIDVHNVRTKPEALMVVLTATGIVRSVRMLAFHEPLDYLPTDRWYTQFDGKSRQDGLRVGRDVHGVVGATLSARAATDAVRRMMAYWEVLLQPAEVATQAP
jgi:Na+-translocating ferredoxin:NAD+ oxidoreductase RnfG subunit